MKDNHMVNMSGIEFDVLDFMLQGKQLEVGFEGVTDPDEFKKVLSERLDMLFEEIKELMLGIASGDNVEIIDALIDIPWIAIGTAYRLYGGHTSIDVIDAISESNLSKVDGSLGPVQWNEIGKVMKPEGFVDPKEKIRAILAKKGF